MTVDDLFVNILALPDADRAVLAKRLETTLLPWEWVEERRFYCRRNLLGQMTAFNQKNAHDMKRADASLVEQGFSFFVRDRSLDTLRAHIRDIEAGRRVMEMVREGNYVRIGLRGPPVTKPSTLRPPPEVNIPGVTLRHSAERETDPDGFDFFDPSWDVLLNGLYVGRVGLDVNADWEFDASDEIEYMTDDDALRADTTRTNGYPSAQAAVEALIGIIR